MIDLATYIDTAARAAAADPHPVMTVDATDIGTVSGIPEGWDVTVTATLAVGLTASVGHRVVLCRAGRGWYALARVPGSGAGGGPS